MRELVHHHDTGTATFTKAADDLDEAHSALTAARNVGISAAILAAMPGVTLSTRCMWVCMEVSINHKSIDMYYIHVHVPHDIGSSYIY